MDINIKPLLTSEQRIVKFDFSIPVNYTENGYKIISDINAVGEVKDMGGYMQLDADCTAEYETSCARCLKKINRIQKIHFMRPIAVRLESDNEEEEYLIVNSNSSVNIDEEVADEMFLSLPLRNLCSDECKGLCPKCGCNKNEKECNCVTKEIDPRWAILKKFTDK